MKNKIKVFFIILMIITGGVSLWQISKLNEYIPLQSYEYEIKVYNVKAINDLIIFHDFSEDRGNISFKIEKENLIDNFTDIILWLPRPIDNSTISIFKGSNKRDLQEIDNWNSKIEDKTQIIINENSLSQDTIYYQIEYEVEISPHAYFTIEHYDTKLYGFTPKIYFNLGKDFLCYKNCIEPIKDIMVDYKSTDKEILLNIDDGDNNEKRFHRFRLNVVREIRFWQSLYIGFIISSIFTFFILIKELLEENIKKIKIVGVN